MRSKFAAVAALTMLGFSAVNAQETENQNFYRLDIDSPIFFSEAPPETAAPLTLTLSGIPVWAPLGSTISGQLVAAGGSRTQSAPTLSGSSVPSTAPVLSQTSPGNWALLGSWLEAGTFDIGYAIVDGGATHRSNSMQVEVSSPLSVASSTLSHHAGANFSIQAVSGGYSAGRTATLANAPAWLNYNQSTGIVSGVMPAANYTQVISASDGFSNDRIGSLTFTVVPKPTITASGATSGLVGTAMTLTLTANNVVGGATWSVTSGTLPPGLSGPDANGVISGIPTAASNASVTFQVQDADGEKATRNIAFSIMALSTWTAATGNLPTGSIQSIVRGADKFIAVGDSGTRAVATSPNGSVWTNHTTPAGATWRGAAYGNGRYVVVGESGSLTNSVMTSTNGTQWELTTTPIANLRAVTFTGSMWVAVGLEGVMTSTDGLSWTRTSTTPMHSVAFGNGVIIGLPTGLNNIPVKSTNGTTWANITMGQNTTWSSVKFAGDKFVFYAAGLFSSTTNGSSITHSSNPVSILTGLAHDGTTYVAQSRGGGGGYRIAVSPDAVTWSPRAQFCSSGGYGLAYGASTWVADCGGQIITATTP